MTLYVYGVMGVYGTVKTSAIQPLALKLTQKVICMPKNLKTKNENFPPCQKCVYPLKRHDFESNFRHASRGQNN